MFKNLMNAPFNPLEWSFPAKLAVGLSYAFCCATTHAMIKDVNNALVLDDQVRHEIRMNVAQHPAQSHFQVTARQWPDTVFDVARTCNQVMFSLTQAGQNTPYISRLAGAWQRPMSYPPLPGCANTGPS